MDYLPGYNFASLRLFRLAISSFQLSTAIAQLRQDSQLVFLHRPVANMSTKQDDNETNGTTDIKAAAEVEAITGFNTASDVNIVIEGLNAPRVAPESHDADEELPPISPTCPSTTAGDDTADGDVTDDDAVSSDDETNSDDDNKVEVADTGMCADIGFSNIETVIPPINPRLGRQRRAEIACLPSIALTLPQQALVYDFCVLSSPPERQEADSSPPPVSSAQKDEGRESPSPDEPSPAPERMQEADSYPPPASILQKDEGLKSPDPAEPSSSPGRQEVDPRLPPALFLQKEGQKSPDPGEPRSPSERQEADSDSPPTSPLQKGKGRESPDLDEVSSDFDLEEEGSYPLSVSWRKGRGQESPDPDPIGILNYELDEQVCRYGKDVLGIEVTLSPWMTELDAESGERVTKSKPELQYVAVEGSR
jgi:hypothetical protein